MIKRMLGFPVYEVKIRIPLWALCFITLLPLIAYSDTVLVGKHGFSGYLTLCIVEVFLILLGYTIALMEIKHD